MADLEMRTDTMQKYKMSLEHLVVPKRKEVLKKKIKD